LLSPFLLALTALGPSSSAQRNLLNPVRSSQKDASGLTIVLEKGALRFRGLQRLDDPRALVARPRISQNCRPRGHQVQLAFIAI